MCGTVSGFEGLSQVFEGVVGDDAYGLGRGEQGAEVDSESVFPDAGVAV